MQQPVIAASSNMIRGSEYIAALKTLTLYDVNTTYIEYPLSFVFQIVQ